MSFAESKDFKTEIVRHTLPVVLAAIFISSAFMAYNVYSILTLNERIKVSVLKAHDALPHFPGAGILVQEMRPGSGSDDKCHGAYVQAIYSAQREFSEILSFYQRELSRADWIDASGDYFVPTFHKGKYLSVSIQEFSLDKDLWRVYPEHQPTLQAEKGYHQTVYMVNTYYSTCRDPY